MKRWLAMSAWILMAGCGAETASTAAIQASLKAQEAEEAKRIQQDVQRQLEAAQQLHEQALKSADQASQ